MSDQTLKPPHPSLPRKRRQKRDPSILPGDNPNGLEPRDGMRYEEAFEFWSSLDDTIEIRKAVRK